MRTKRLWRAPRKLLLLVACLSLLAVACGDETGGEGGDSDPAAPADGDADGTEGAAPGDATPGEDAVEIDMFYPIAVGGALTSVVDGLVERFEEENPDVSVNAIYSGGYGETLTKAQTAASSGEPPAVAVLATVERYQLIDQGIVVPYDELMDAGELAEWTDGFYEAFMEDGRAESQVWSIPFQRSTTVQYYNKDLFEEAGLDPDDPPDTWDEVLEASQAIVDSGAAPWGIQIPSSGFPYWLFQGLAYQNGAVIVGDDGTETFFDDPAAIEALEFWVSLGQEHQVMPSGVIDWGTTPEDFLQGETAMMWHTTGNLGNVRDNADFDFGVSMMPANEQRGSATGGGNFYIFDGVSEDEQQAALRLVRWLTQPEILAEWSIATGYVGPRPDVYETEEMVAYTEDFPAALAARDQLENTTPEIAVYDQGRVTSILNDALQAALTGETPPAEALEGAQQQADSVLQRYR